MIKDVFVLKKGSWHSRLMKYTWNLSHKDFSHICPYFWLSIFNVIICPVFLPLKFLFKKCLPFVGMYVGLFLKWVMRNVCDFFDTIGNKMDAWAVESDRKWYEKHQSSLISMDQRVVDKILDISEGTHNVSIDIFLNKLKDSKGNRYYEDNIRDQIANLEYHSKVSKSAGRIGKFFKMLYDMHKLNPEAFAQFNERYEEKWRLVREKQAKIDKEDRIKRFRKDMQSYRDNVIQERILANQEAEETKLFAEELARREAEKKRKKELYERSLIKADQRVINKQRINKILKIVKPIATGIIWIVGSSLAIGGLYLLYRGGTLVVHGVASIPHSTYVGVGHVIKWIGIVVLGLAVIFGLIYVIIVIGKRIKLPAIHINWPKVKLPRISIHINWTPIKILGIAIEQFLIKILRIITYIVKLLPKGAKYIIYPFVQLFKGIGLFFRILIQTIKNNCPAIDWED